MDQPSRDNVYPYVVPTAHVGWANKGMWLSWPIANDVSVALVFYCNGIVSNARPDELAALGLGDDAALERAIKNLADAFSSDLFEIALLTLDDGTEIGCAQGSWMAPAGGLLLGELYERMCTRFDRTEFAAIAPNQETLLAFVPDHETLYSPSLRAFANERFQRHRKPISKSWLSLDGGWPRAFAGAQAF